MSDDLKYDSPKNLSVQKILEISFGIDWWRNQENVNTYEKEKEKIHNKK